MFELDLKHINTDEFRIEALKFLANKKKHGEGFYIDRKLKGLKSGMTIGICKNIIVKMVFL